eukprot:221803-Rhodomonas_salina.2
MALWRMLDSCPLSAVDSESVMLSWAYWVSTSTTTELMSLFTAEGWPLDTSSVSIVIAPSHDELWSSRRPLDAAVDTESTIQGLAAPSLSLTRALRAMTPLGKIKFTDGLLLQSNTTSLLCPLNVPEYEN